MTRRQKLEAVNGEWPFSEDLRRFYRFVANQTPEMQERWCNHHYANCKAFVEGVKSEPVILRFPNA